MRSHCAHTFQYVCWISEYNWAEDGLNTAETGSPYFTIKRNFSCVRLVYEYISLIFLAWFLGPARNSKRAFCPVPKLKKKIRCFI
jgi:hypothetical protein